MFTLFYFTLVLRVNKNTLLYTHEFRPPHSVILVLSINHTLHVKYDITWQVTEHHAWITLIHLLTIAAYLIQYIISIWVLNVCVLFALLFAESGSWRHSSKGIIIKLSLRTHAKAHGMTSETAERTCQMHNSPAHPYCTLKSQVSKVDKIY